MNVKSQIDKTPTSNHYKLVAIDVDGTLLNSQHQISAGAAESIARITDRKIHVVLVSGRSFLLLQDFIAALRVSPYYIGSGGAMVATTAGEVIAFTPVKRVEAEAITRKARQRDLGVCYHESSQQHCEISDPDMRARLRTIAGSNITFVEDILSSTTNAPQKITVFSARPELERFRLELLEESYDVNMTYSGPIYLEITRRGVSKGNAVIQLIEHLGIQPEQVVAVGDQQNDISMFKVAGLAIAMGNAPEEVKSAASVVAPDNDDGGLAWALNECILNTYSDLDEG